MNVNLPSTRRQATLFLDNVPDIESVRASFDPVQAALINAHITLLREDEVADWELIAAKLNDGLSPVRSEIGPVVRDGDLIFLKVQDIYGDLGLLRRELMGENARQQMPHLTLIHPRNIKCSDENWNDIRNSIRPFKYTFRRVSFILQENGGIWRTVAEFPLERPS